MFSIYFQPGRKYHEKNETLKQERNNIAIFDQSISVIHPQLEEMTKAELNFSISRFICEARKENGEEYPGHTLYELKIQLFLEQNVLNYKLLNENYFIQVK